MQNRKDKRTKANAGKTATSGSIDAKKGVTDVGKGAPGKTEIKKGWKK